MQPTGSMQNMQFGIDTDGTDGTVPGVPRRATFGGREEEDARNFDVGLSALWLGERQQRRAVPEVWGSAGVMRATGIDLGTSGGRRLVFEMMASGLPVEEELMAKQSPTFRDFNPTGDVRVTRIKGQADMLIATVREFTAASGPETQRRAALAVTDIEQGAMWAVKALFSEDAVRGDDGGGDAGSA
jgi:hypothetical protein